MAKNIPLKEKISGIFFIYSGINSMSMKVLWYTPLYIEFPNTVLPNPINKSFNNQPEKILPNANVNKENPILIGSSCMFCI
jgi:hypothetical protein